MNSSRSKFLLIIFIIAIVLVQCKFRRSLTRNNIQNNRFILTVQIHHFIVVHRQYRTCFNINGVFVKSEITSQYLSPLQRLSGSKFIPLSLRKPYFHFGITILHRWSCRSYHYIITKHILIAVIISFLRFRIIIIHWATEWQSCFISLTSHCVNIRYHIITLANDATQNIRYLITKYPRLFCQTSNLRTMWT